MQAKRIFLIVLDSFGIGAMEDAADFGDAGSNTIGAVSMSEAFCVPNMEKLGLMAIDGVTCTGAYAKENLKPQVYIGSYGRLEEMSKGKDTTTGHWEMAGIISKTPMPVYPKGFPEEVLEPFKKATGRDILCNKPYSGTQVIMDYGQEHIDTGKFIVYTSADSVFQIAAHEDIVPVEKLYEYCQMAREILQGKHGVGRVIARPFTGTYPDFKRTSRRHDFSLVPPKKTVLNQLEEAGMASIGVGKIYDIFSGQGITQTYRTNGNEEGMTVTASIAKEDFTGLCFVNLVDFDMLYGHRNDVEGYATALTQFDSWLGTFMEQMQESDLLIVTADHGCDPSTVSTDHSREYVPLLMYGAGVEKNKNMGTIKGFDVIAQIIQRNFNL